MKNKRSKKKASEQKFELNCLVCNNPFERRLNVREIVRMSAQSSAQATTVQDCIEANLKYKVCLKCLRQFHQYELARKVQCPNCERMFHEFTLNKNGDLEWQGRTCSDYCHKTYTPMIGRQISYLPIPTEPTPQEKQQFEEYKKDKSTEEHKKQEAPEQNKSWLPWRW